MRSFARFLLLILLMIGGGLVVFSMSLPRAADFDIADAKSNISGASEDRVGLVVLTGGRGARIQVAFDIFDASGAERMLISGTHPDVRKADLAERFDPDTLACCVDLGTEAQTTTGNAREALAWATKHGYTALYIVTHDYHLPRAMLELKKQSSDIELVGVPVKHDTDDKGWRVTAKEYGKFLLAVVRSVM